MLDGKIHIFTSTQRDGSYQKKVSRSVRRRLRNVSDKSCVENQNTYFVFNNLFFFQNCAVCEIMRKNIVESGRLQVTIWRMRIAFCIPKSTNTHSEYLILTAFPLQQWLHERASILRVRALPVLYVLPTECIYAFLWVSEQIAFISMRTISVWFS